MNNITNKKENAISHNKALQLFFYSKEKNK